MSATVDAHAHVHPTVEAADAFRALVGAPWIGSRGDVDDALATMERYGVQTMVLLPILIGRSAYERRLEELGGGRGRSTRALEEIAEQWSEYNAWARDTARVHPGRFVALVGLDPVLLGADWTREEIERGLREGARGLKIAPGVIGVPPGDERMAVLWELAERHGIPVVAQSGTPHFAVTHPDEFEPVLRRYPHVKLILAHAGVGAENRTLALARTYPNLHVDTSTWFAHRTRPSALNTAEGREPWTLDEATAFFRGIGVDRVLLGTNFGLHDPEPTHVGVRSVPLTDAERDLVLGENAARIFGIAA